MSKIVAIDIGGTHARFAIATLQDGRVVGLSDAKLAHLRNDPLPDGIYSPAEAAIVRFAQTSTRMAPISDALFAELSAHFDTQQLIELCFTVGNSGIA